VAVAEVMSLTCSLVWTALAGIALAGLAWVAAKPGGRHQAPAFGAAIGATFPTHVIRWAGHQGSRAQRCASTE
jgi:hypothetical protein